MTYKRSPLRKLAKTGDELANMEKAKSKPKPSSTSKSKPKSSGINIKPEEKKE